MKNFQIAFLFAMLLIQSCSTAVVATPTLEQPGPTLPTSTLVQPNPIPLTPTAEILEPAPTPTFEPPTGFKEYQDPVIGVSIYIPENWVLIEVDPGRLAHLQSYPEDKYIGGEAFQPSDTKCDLTIRPPDMDVASHIQQRKTDSTITIVSEEEIILQSGKQGTKLEIDSMGRSLSLVTEVNNRTVVLTCFGELVPFDEIAGTLNVGEIIESTPLPVPDVKIHEDAETGISVTMPGSWVVTGIIPGHRATFQSYPEGKYIGGEVFQPGDTKCDLFIRPPDISAVDFVQQMKSNDSISVVSEEEIILQSGQPGFRLEVESMGRSLMLITEINAQTVVLSCFGELELFNEIVVTLNTSE
jgi:hypothetical protein